MSALRIHTLVILMVVLTVVGGCSRRDSVPPLQAAAPRNEQSVTQSGSFFQYTLPSNVYGVSYLANGPSNTVWFACTSKWITVTGAWGFGAWPVCEMTSTGAVTESTMSPPPFSPPPPYYVTSKRFSISPIISNAGGYLWYEVYAAYLTAYCGSVCTYGPTFYRRYLVRRVATGSVTLFATTQSFGNAILGSDGNVWLPAANVITAMSPGASTGPTQRAQLPANWNAMWVTCRYNPCSSVDPYIYVLAYYGSPPSSNAVFKIALNGQRARTYSLPVGSNAQNITAGPDGNLWITEAYASTGPSEIARLQPSTGAITQFTVSASNIGLGSITNAAGALWFTESLTNEIGRITTSFGLTQQTVPTASAKPNGIIPCPSAVCGSHGGVWFAETALNEIGRYDFP